MPQVEAPIGVVDSGIGGLSVLRALQHRLPHEDWLYFADQAHLPYGRRDHGELRRFARRITRFLVEQGIKALVVACNTLSAVALEDLRAAFPGLPIVGMEPAIKPAVQASRRKRVGVLATGVTLASPRYQALKARYGNHTRFWEDPCPGLVESIEAHGPDAPQVRGLLRAILEPMRQAGVDVVVLGCTHYPLVAHHIARLLGPEVTVLDPAHAVARRLEQVLREHGRMRPPTRTGVVRYFTTGSGPRLEAHVKRLVPHLAGPVHELRDFWQQEEP